MAFRILRLVFFAAFLAALASAQGKAVDLSWMAGVWNGEQPGGTDTEMWTEPDANGEMFGAYRFVKDGKPVFYELLAIERQDGQPVLVLRHFHRGLVAWEDKDAALRFSVAQTAPGEVLFRQTFPAGKATTLRYRRVEPDSLHVELTHVRDGKPEKTEFHFRRQGAPARH